MSLTLKAHDITKPWQWRWLLVESGSDAPLTDHQVHLESTSTEVQAFLHTYEMLRWGFIARESAQFEDVPCFDVVQLGRFVGDLALGSSIVRAIVERAPVTVRVEVPVGAEWLAPLPWELAYADGQSLAARGDITLVYDLQSVPRSPSTKEPVARAVRILGVFSQPTSTPCPILRQERLHIERLARVLARSRRRMEFVVAQYGITRDQLADLANDGEGWDILHLSADTATGQINLQQADGRPDPLSSGDLLDTLEPIRRRVKLAVITSHESFAATTALVLQEIGDSGAARSLSDQAWRETTLSAANLEPLALDLARRLACAVVAMRHPVKDAFHSTFNERLYQQLLGTSASVDQAVASARYAAVNGIESDPSGMCAPAIYGGSAVGLAITPPQSKPTFDLDQSPVAYLPDEPDQFIGQNDAMTAASRALAPDSSQSGVVFCGGTGKTWCASELAHRHKEAFEALVYWQFPNGRSFADGFALLAEAWERQLGRYGFSMVQEVRTSNALEAYLPKLRVLLRNHGLLLILDGLDPLLTESGKWRDPRWPDLVDVLIGHGGESRVVFTSREIPARLEPPLVEVQRIGMLSRYESLHLARHLTALSSWLSDDLPLPSNSLGASRREVALKILNIWQGHPQLLTYADAALSDLANLPTFDEITVAADAAKASTDRSVVVPDADAIQQTLQNLTNLRAAEDSS